MNKVTLDDQDKQKNTEKSESMPPIASNGEINLWLDEDKNGNQFVRIEAPFLDTEPVFFHDDVKTGINQLVQKWEEQRNGGE